MVACGKCQLQNSLDSSFCRRCGTVLDADVLQQAKSELGRTVGQGYVLFNEGKVDEAALIAEMAVGEDPTLTTAISLKGMCHERRGELSDALASYEKVLELAPDSALDRIKVSQLRAAISAKATLVEEERAVPDKKMALAVAVFAIIFFGGVGVLASRLLAEAQTKTVVASNVKPGDTSEAVGFTDPAPVANKQVNPTPNTTPASQPGTVSNIRGVEPSSNPDEAAPAVGNQNRNNTDDGNQTSVRPISVNPNGTLPPAVIERMNSNPVGLPDGPVGTNSSVGRKPDPDPAPVADPGRANQGPQTAPSQDPVEDPGQIEINVTNRGPKNSGGGQAVDDGSSAQNLGKVASQEFQLKRYDSAAKKYEKLLHSGGDPAHVNQRLAQCYENLGKKSDALTAYQRAAKALKENIQSGKGNVSRDKAALETCETAIKVLNEGV